MLIFHVGECSAFEFSFVPFEFTDTSGIPRAEGLATCVLYREHADEFATGSENGAIILGSYRVKDPYRSPGPTQE